MSCLIDTDFRSETFRQWLLLGLTDVSLWWRLLQGDSSLATGIRSAVADLLC